MTNHGIYEREGTSRRNTYSTTHEIPSKMFLIICTHEYENFTTFYHLLFFFKKIAYHVLNQIISYGISSTL
jgi:hypothetical protein